MGWRDWLPGRPRVKDPDIVLCVPGTWSDRSELVTRIAGESGGYLFAGGVLMDMATREGFGLEVEEPDPRVTQAFAAVGGHWATPEDLDQIAGHTFVLYLVSPGGSRERAERALAAAGGLLRAGGLAVKVETAGIAHSRAAWLEFVEDRHLFSAHQALVAVVTSPEVVYSCGMHNLGCRDTVVDVGDAADPVTLVRSFNFYQFSERPTLRDGETFSSEPGAPRFRLSAEPCTLHDGDPYYTNPYGMWRLRPND